MLNFHLNYNLNDIFYTNNCSIAKAIKMKKKIWCISLLLVIKATAVATLKENETREKKIQRQTNIAFRLLIIRILSIAIVSNVSRIYDTSSTAAHIFNTIWPFY